MRSSLLSSIIVFAAACNGDTEVEIACEEYVDNATVCFEEAYADDPSQLELELQSLNRQCEDLDDSDTLRVYQCRSDVYSNADCSTLDGVADAFQQNVDCV